MLPLPFITWIRFVGLARHRPRHLLRVRHAPQPAGARKGEGMSNLWKRKSLESAHRPTPSEDGHALKKTLGAVNLIALGIGAIIGAGLFVRTAAAAADHAGPSVTLALRARRASAARSPGLCYAEFASMIPIAGSAYTYSYATLGELIAWIIGWDLVLEYASARPPSASRGASTSTSCSSSCPAITDPLRVVPLAVRVDGRAGIAHGIMNMPARVHRAHAVAAAHPRHEGVGVRQRHHRHHQGRDRHPDHRLRLELHRSGEPHAVHPGAADGQGRRRASRTTSAASSASSAPPASSSSPSSASTRSRRRRKRRSTPSATCRSASSARSSSAPCSTSCSRTC